MMIDMIGPVPRAVGRRIGYTELPPFVRSWVAAQFGPVQVVREHVGGMSPGCATSVRTAEGRMLFVKAVGAELNEFTIDLFGKEIALLRRLPAVPYRPVLRAALDDAGWVAVVLDHVDGRFPDLAVDADFAAVAATLHRQVAELTPAPDGVTVLPLATTAERWANRWTQHLAADPGRYLPPWAVARFDELHDRVGDLAGQLPTTTLCHFDVRDDNLLVRPDGAVVVLDWGLARLGPAWTDLVMLAAQRPTAAAAQQWLQRWVPSGAEELVTSFVLAFGGSQAWNGEQPAQPSLPTLAAFCRADARRLLAIAELRLSAG